MGKFLANLVYIGLIAALIFTLYLFASPYQSCMRRYSKNIFEGLVNVEEDRIYYCRNQTYW